MILVLAVAVAGGVGSVARFLADGAVQDRSAGPFPFGTASVNGIGSFILGVVTGLAWYHGLGESARTVVGVGFCGAFTTWSGVTWETLRLLEDGFSGQALLHVAGSTLAALALAALGMVLAAAL